jgi:MurNAc alpha-1-phosphate uridylyltransferase
MSPQCAMVLAAGLGLRMRPLTECTPKPLLEVAGKALLDHALDQLARAGVETAVVNVHYRADQVEAHLARRTDMRIVVSDERGRLLDTGGGIAKALAHLGAAPFFVSNADNIWLDGPVPLLDALHAAWDDARMDCLLGLAPPGSLGYDGRGDFHRAADGRLARYGRGSGEILVNSGIYLVHPRLFAACPSEPFSMNVLWDRAIAQRRLYGIVAQGEWMHVGSPAALAQAEARLVDLSYPQS